MLTRAGRCLVGDCGFSCAVCAATRVVDKLSNAELYIRLLCGLFAPSVVAVIALHNLDPILRVLEHPVESRRPAVVVPAAEKVGSDNLVKQGFNGRHPSLLPAELMQACLDFLLAALGEFLYLWQKRPADRIPFIGNILIRICIFFSLLFYPLLFFGGFSRRKFFF